MTHLNPAASVCTAPQHGNHPPGRRWQLTMLPLIVLLCALVACDGADTGLLREPPLGAKPGSQFPSLAVSPDGVVVLSWIADAGSGHALQFVTSTPEQGWSAPQTVASGEQWLVNWADFPSVIPITPSFWVAQWLVRTPQGHGYHAFVSTSVDAGGSWSVATRLHTDSSPTEHGFVSLFPTREAAGAIWLDGRNGAEGMSLRTATVTPLGEVIDEQLVDPLVCDCCQTDAAATRGDVFVAYRNRSPEEVRDVHVARLAASGWQPDQPVAGDNWIVNGCPVNGPAIDAAASTLAVAWYTAADGSPRVRLARRDGDAGFTPARDVASGSILGRVDVAQLADGDTIVSWLAETPQGSAVLRLARIDAGGQQGPTLDLLETATSRPAGFPRMLQAAGVLYFAWTDVSQAPYIVRSGWLSLDQVPRADIRTDADRGAGEPAPE